MSAHNYNKVFISVGCNFYPSLLPEKLYFHANSQSIDTHNQIDPNLCFLRNTSRRDFKFYADRLVSPSSSLMRERAQPPLPPHSISVADGAEFLSQIRLVIEESLNQLPYTPCTVVTPIGCPYEGLRFEKGNCGVSIVRSGEAMEQGLRDCCRSIRIGKILVHSDHDTHEAQVVYAKFPEDISQRKVLLMYPIMSEARFLLISS